MNRILIILFILITVSSCDYFNDPPIKFIGNLYMWNTDGGNRKSLNLKTSENTYSLIDTDGTVSVALGNDSIIYIKSESQEYPLYHLIKHKDGEKIITNIVIDSTDFIKFEKSNKFKYKYYSK